MFTKCFFSAPKVLFVCEIGAFIAKNVLFFPWKGALFLPKSTMIPVMSTRTEQRWQHLLHMHFINFNQLAFNEIRNLHLNQI